MTQINPHPPRFFPMHECPGTINCSLSPFRLLNWFFKATPNAACLWQFVRASWKFEFHRNGQDILREIECDKLDETWIRRWRIMTSWIKSKVKDLFSLIVSLKEQIRIVRSKWKSFINFQRFELKNKLFYTAQKIRKQKKLIRMWQCQ